MMYGLAAIGTVIGILLGLLGGGGSILTVPVLVYLAGMTAKHAIFVSLIVIGITSSIAVISHARKKHVCWKIGLAFGVAGMAGAYFGGRLTKHIPDALLLILFALVMVGAAFAMLRKKPVKGEKRLPGELSCPFNLAAPAVLIDGFIVGMITGLVGVGGGFLLVPALNYLAGLPIHAAIGTSLLIIVLQCGAALLGHASHFTPDWLLTGFFTGFTVLGSLIGSRLSAKISGALLKRGFGVFVLAIGVFMLYRQSDATLLLQIRELLIAHEEYLLGLLTGFALLAIYRLWVWLHMPR